MSRRTFLGISGGAAAGLIALHYINWPDLDLFSSSEDIGEGVIDEILPWPTTSCLNCPARCAIKVRVVNGEVVRIIGNSNSTYSDGKTCPRSHIGLQVLYDPNRIKKPLLRKNGKNEEPEWQEIDWEGNEGALNIVKNKLKDLIDSDNADKLLIIQGLNTTSDEDLINRFAKSFGTPNLLREDRLEKEADRAGKKLADGCSNSGYDLENANYILSFGADIIESEDPLSRNLRLWGKIRRERPNKARVVVVGSRYSVTASKADEWLPINPGTEGVLAMAIANVIIDEDLYDKDFIEGSYVYGFDDYKNTVLSNDFSPDNVSQIAGIDAEDIRRIAREFASYKPAIAWSGIGATSCPHGTYTSHAVYCLNALVGSIDVKGGIIYQESPPYTDMPDIDGDDPGISLREAKDGLSNSNIDVAIGFNNNLIMAVPDTSTWGEALANVPYYVHIGSAMTEMAQYADIVLPACTYLEEWAYESALPGSGYAEAKIKQPVINPLYQSRATAKIIFELVDELGGDVETRFGKTNIGCDPEGFVKYRTNNFVSWDTFKADGVWKGDDYQYRKYDQIFETDSGKFKFHAGNLSLDRLTSDYKGSSSDNALVLTTYHPVLDIRNGNQNYPWAQEIFLVMHGYGWNNFVEINSENADQLGIEDMDWVWVESSSGNKIKVKARVFEGTKPGAVAIALGQGHTCGEWANDIGVNPNYIICEDYDIESGQPSFSNTRVKIYRA